MGIAIRWKRGKREKIEKYRARYIYIYIYTFDCEIAKGCCEPPLGGDANFSRSIITLNAFVDVEKNIRCAKFKVFNEWISNGYT